MNIQSNISNVGIFIVLILAISLALVFSIYFFKKNKDEFLSYQRYLLSVIKFGGFFLVVVLLLSPLVETVKKRIERPILILAIDNSESMLVDSTNKQLINRLIDEANISLSDKFQVESFSFGEQLRPLNELQFNEQTSNYSGLFSELDKRFYNLNVGAMVLLGDGIYNDGKNPGQDDFRLDAPVYTVGIGDTLAKMDQAIVDVTHNPNVFLNNEFPLEVDVTFNDFPQTNTQLSVYMDGKLIKSETIDVLQSNYFYQHTFNIKAGQPGLRNVEIVLSPLLNESNKRNNRNSFTIEVHDNKKKILILSQGPHPDIGAMMQTLNSQANFNIRSSEVSTFGGTLSEYDLVVLNQLPSLRTQHLPLFDEIAKTKVPLLLFLGPTTSIAALNNLKLDFHMNPTLMTQESTPYFNGAFSLFSLPTNVNEVERIYPPLLAPFTEYQFGDEYSVLAYQKINGIEMNYPQMIAGDINGRKTGIIIGEGIWRWRFYEYQNYDNQNVFNHLLVNLFNYLCLKEEREQFRINYDHIAAETTPVKMKAQVFNEIYEPVNNAEIRLTLTDSIGNELSYLFDTNELEYNLNMGFLKPGNYNFDASTSLGEKEYHKKGQFSVEEVNIEHQKTQSDFNVLHLISAKTGGRFYDKLEVDELINQLKEDQSIQTKTHMEKIIHEFIDLKWLALIILLLFSLEWFLRKFWGSY